MLIALIQFRKVGKKYYFSIPENLKLEKNDLVVVETSVGVEVGEVYLIKEENEVEITQALKPILRKANESDIYQYYENKGLEEEIIKTTQNLSDELKLGMSILKAEYTLDREKLTIYFKADGRVDFRELVRRLNSIYKTRIELRQIGPRDVAKMVGGIGPCGLLLCCSTFIGDFEPVTIKMAKNQNIALNPTKMSGVCGKLLCCLKFEDDVYTELREIMPDISDAVYTEKGPAKVIDVNLISQKVRVKYEGEELSIEWLTLEGISNEPINFNEQV